METFFKISPDVFIKLNSNFEFDSISSSGKKYLKDDLDILKGKSFFDQLDKDYVDEIKQLLKEDNSEVNRPFPLFTDELGNIAWFNFFHKKVENSYYLQLTNVTKLYEHGEENNNLVKVLCHDLYNSINIIKNSLKLMDKMGHPENVKYVKNIDKVKRSINNILEIVDTVKEYQALESGKKELEFEKIGLSSIIENTNFFFKDRMEEKKITFTCINNVPEETFISVEPSAFKNSIINNLISNALKFSKENDEIQLVANVEKENIKISIIDNGIGIPEEILKNLYNPSKKTSRVGTLGEKGTGFGMPLIKSYIDRFNATIEIETREQENHPEDHGTTFHIIIPIQK
jgi:signal transduction histidine kinase